MVRYTAYKRVSSDGVSAADMEARHYNLSLLREGVEGVECIEVRKPTQGEIMDYTPYIPWGTFISSVEVYANGSRNFHVRVGETLRGVVRTRPG